MIDLMILAHSPHPHRIIPPNKTERAVVVSRSQGHPRILPPCCPPIDTSGCRETAAGSRFMTIVPRATTKGGGGGDATAGTGGGGCARGRDHHMPGPPLPSGPRPSSSRARWLILLLGCYALGVTIHIVVQSGSSGCEQLLGVGRRAAATDGGSGWTPAALLRLGDGQAKAEAEASTATDDFRNPSLAEGPLTVVAISQSRTSSTVAFNLARILLERLDPTTVSGWESDLVGLEDEFDKEWKARLLREALAPAHEGASVLRWIDGISVG